MNNIIKILDSLNVRQSEQLLERVSMEPAPASIQRRLMRKACAKTGLRNRAARPFWLIPVAAVLLAGAAVASIPDARAAVALFFDRLFRIENYMSEDKEDRTQIAEIESLIQTPLPAQTLPEGNTQQAVFSDISPDAPFMNDIGVEVTETLYDGEKLIIGATVTGDFGFLLDKDMFLSQEYSISPSCDLWLTDADGYNQFLLATANLIPPGGFTGVPYQGPEPDSLRLTITTEPDIDASGRTPDFLTLKGMQDVRLELRFAKFIPEDENTDRAEAIGSCTISYAFDATAGSKSMKSVSPDQTVELSGNALVTEMKTDGSDMLVKNTELPLGGSIVKVSTVNVKPTGITLKLLYRAPYGWTTLQQESFLRGEGTSLSFRLLVNGEDTGNFTSSSGWYDETWRYALIEIPLTGGKQPAIETLEVLPVVYHLTKVNGIAVTGDEQRIPIQTLVNGHVTESGWSQGEDYTALTWNQFSIDLP